MRWINRLKDIVSVRVHTVLERFEDPENMAAQTLCDLEEGLDALRQQAAMAVAVERRLGRDLERQQNQAQHWRERAKLALAQEREDLARWALGRGLQQQDLVRDLQAQHHAARQASTEVKQALQTLEDRLAAAQRRHLVLVAQHRTAQVRQAAQQTVRSETGNAAALLTRLDHWEERLTASADLLLALVEVSHPLPDEERELADLEEFRRIDVELEALKREKDAQL